MTKQEKVEQPEVQTELSYDDLVKVIARDVVKAATDLTNYGKKQSEALEDVSKAINTIIE